MKQILGLICLFFISTQIVKAENITSDELLTRFKTHRNAVYQKLDLTEKQARSIKKIDEKVYTKLEPELMQVSFYINKLEEIAKSSDCTIERVDAVKKEFQETEKRISVIKTKYEKSINQVLTQEQKSAYEEAKEIQRKEIQKEIEAITETHKL